MACRFLVVDCSSISMSPPSSGDGDGLDLTTLCDFAAAAGALSLPFKLAAISSSSSSSSSSPSCCLFLFFWPRFVDCNDARGGVGTSAEAALPTVPPIFFVFSPLMNVTADFETLLFIRMS